MAINTGAIKGISLLMVLKRFYSYKLLNTWFIISLCFILSGNFLVTIFWFYYFLIKGILIYSSLGIRIGP
jgi:hypothetical protein